VGDAQGRKCRLMRGCGACTSKAVFRYRALRAAVIFDTSCIESKGIVGGYCLESGITDGADESWRGAVEARSERRVEAMERRIDRCIRRPTASFAAYDIWS
jgi:hypothetical protein